MGCLGTYGMGMDMDVVFCGLGNDDVLGMRNEGQIVFYTKCLDLIMQYPMYSGWLAFALREYAEDIKTTFGFPLMLVFLLPWAACVEVSVATRSTGPNSPCRTQTETRI